LLADCILTSDFRPLGYHCFDLYDTSTLTSTFKLATRPSSDFSSATAPTTASNMRAYYTDYAGTNYDPYLLITTTETSTSTLNTPTSSIMYNNDLTYIQGISHTYDSTGNYVSTQAISYHIPFFAWLVLCVVTLWIMSRIIIEFSIRLRKS